MFRFALAAAGLTAYLSAVEASVSVTISNSCSESVALYDNSATETLAAGGSTTRTLANGYVGMYRNGVSDEATLAEISVDSDGTPWFDISIIPPDSGSCTSLSACQSQTGNTGFNTAIQMAPQSNIGEDTCETLTCEADGCSDAYQYPSDDTKTHTCPEGTGFEIIFCPGGSGGSSTSTSTSTSTTSASTSSSTPEPTTATPTPTTATPTPSTATPSPSPSEASASASASAASHGQEVESEAYTGNFTLSSASASASAASAGTQSSNSQGNAGVEAAGDTTTAPVATSSGATTETTGTTTSSSGSDGAVEVSTQSSGSGSSSFTIIFAAGVCVLGVASAGFIYAVRQKKKKLDMESKSPMETVDRSCRDISVLVSTPESLSARL
ncbi:hypothetical protein BBJ28_00015984 [Nothophytophthora sp. Chile5]|nr:hypothetical protein BBJ28_00015984 [Nothophytophthora sp. Chile5]